MPRRALALLPVCLPVTLLLTPPGEGAAQAIPQLQPLDAVHHDLDRLRAWGLIDTVLVGQRPYTRHQAALLTAQALRARGRLAGDPALGATAGALLERLGSELASELARMGVVAADDARPSLVVSGARLDGVWTDSPTRAVPTNQVASSAAQINPLLAYDLGREVEEGATAGLEVEVQVSLGGWLAGAVRPRAQWASSGSGQAVATVHLQSGHLRLLAGNAALTLGRAHTIWGQGQRGGLILSTNPGTLLLARLATEEPVRLPWVLARLGPSLHQLFLADLGTEAQRFPHAHLFGMRSSFLPHRQLEVGMQFLVESGGEGGPTASLGDRVLDYLFFPDLFTDQEFTFSNKVAGFDLRLRAPWMRGLELYLELVIDDIDIDRFRSMIWDDGSWTAGVRLARLNDAGTVALSLEGQHTGIRLYEHSDYTSGLTLRRRLLGSELGPNGNGLRVALDWEPDSRDALSVEGAVERRSNDPYLLVVGNPFYFARLGIRPKELRWRGAAAWVRRGGGTGAWRMRVEGGYEYVANYAFSRDATQHNFLVRTVVEMRLR